MDLAHAQRNFVCSTFARDSNSLNYYATRTVAEAADAEQPSNIRDGEYPVSINCGSENAGCVNLWAKWDSYAFQSEAANTLRTSCAKRGE